MANSSVLKSTFACGMLGVITSLGLVGCGREAPPAADQAQDANSKEAELAARERALDEREAAVAAQQQAEAEAAAAAAKAQADAESAAVAKAEQDKAAAEAKHQAAERAAAAKRAERDRVAGRVVAKEEAAAKAAALESAKPIQVPAGTQIAMSLSQAISSKTAKVGDAFSAVVSSDITVGNRVAVPAGTRVSGSVIHVVSGSQAIGAVPVVGLKFEELVLASGARVPISGELTETGASEKGRDTAKIVGGAAAGAVIGHQVKNNDTGKVLGGLLGGAIGAIAAKKTGTEAIIPDGAPLTISTTQSFTVPAR